MDRDENDMRDEAARPFCTNCGTAMWLHSRVATGSLSEVRQFKCPVCDRTQIVLASLGVVEIERSAGHAERFNTRSMDRAGRE
jgi:hypothetical protein